MSFTRHDSEARFGAVDGDEVLDMTERLGARRASLLAVLEADALGEVRDAMASPGPRHALADIAWLEPIPSARRVFCVGANYPKEHPLGGQVAAPEHPSIFQKPAESLVPHGGALCAPVASEQFDYEGELAVVIGRGGARIPEAEALSHVAG